MPRTSQNPDLVEITFKLPRPLYDWLAREVEAHKRQGLSSNRNAYLVRVLAERQHQQEEHPHG